MRRFNTAGPCRAEAHYMLPAAARLPDVRRLVAAGEYFVVHAPRQSGKTTALRALARALTDEGQVACVLVSAEVASPFGSLTGAERPMLASWRSDALDLPESLRPPAWPEAPDGSRVRVALEAWAMSCPRPLALFIDEIDALRGEVLFSVLRQLRAGHDHRPGRFPASLALVGLRDVRDCRLDDDERRAGTSSPFNVKVESLTLADFDREEVALLLGQHVEATGQPIEPSALGRVYELTRGQPWLVNALAKEAVERIRPAPDPIADADIERAAARVILRRDTHLDSLAARLEEPRVRSILEPMLAGDLLGRTRTDDQQFLVDLGLLRWSDEGGLEVSNPIYREIIVRELAQPTAASLPRVTDRWTTPEGRLDPQRLMEAFSDFWCQHGEALQASAPYAEIAPHLVLMAFLHRVTNGGGRIEREYAVGRGRMDVHLELGGVEMAIEVKVWRPGKPDPVPTGLVQLDGYLDRLGLPRGWLVVFDQRPATGPRPERSTARSAAGRDLEVWVL